MLSRLPQHPTCLDAWGNIHGTNAYGELTQLADMLSYWCNTLCSVGWVSDHPRWTRSSSKELTQSSVALGSDRSSESVSFHHVTLILLQRPPSPPISASSSAEMGPHRHPFQPPGEIKLVHSRAPCSEQLERRPKLAHLESAGAAFCRISSFLGLPGHASFQLQDSPLCPTPPRLS